VVASVVDLVLADLVDSPEAEVHQEAVELAEAGKKGSKI